ncbi:MAG: sensor histidine kinase [Bdellovibrio bacteriovorus]
MHSSSVAVPKVFPRLTRYYAVASLIGVVIAAVTLGILYRELSIRVLLRFGEQSNVAVARTTVHALGPDLIRYLETIGPPDPAQGLKPLPGPVLDVISGTIRDTSVARVKIYNRDGVVAYSSRPHDVGTNDSANPRFQGAMRGEVRSDLSYRDAFSLLGRGGHDDNLIETYVPIIPAGLYRPVGVLEMYTDVHPIVAAMNRNEILVFLGIGGIMLALYGVLVFAVRRSEGVIAQQRQTILERNRTLEVLSARMLAAEDNERRRIATELHEEIAQTLSAAKLRVESYALAASRSKGGRRIDPDQEIVPLVREAIRDVRALAMELRPPSLDDFGLLTTLRALCRELQAGHPRLELATDLEVDEGEIPEALKGTIFRILQETLKRVSRRWTEGRVRIALGQDAPDRLVLEVEVEHQPNDTGPAAENEATEKETIAAVWERAVLSGASLEVARSDPEGCQCRAVWEL